jgi:hypothetical protein
VSDDRLGVDHVIDAIDSALDWDGFSDAMVVSYGDNGDGAPEGVAALPGHYRPAMPWFAEPHGGPDESGGPPGYLLPESWQPMGYITDTPSAFLRTDDGNVEEIRTWGSETPIRIRVSEDIPRNVVVIGQIPADLLAGFDLTPYISGVSFGFDAAAVRAGFERAAVSTTELGEACQRAADTVRESWAPLMLEIAERLRFDAATRRFNMGALFDEFVWGPSGILPDPDEELTPRERALKARRNRNTGPPRNPHRHRGI